MTKKYKGQVPEIYKGTISYEDGPSRLRIDERTGEWGYKHELSGITLASGNDIKSLDNFVKKLDRYQKEAQSIEWDQIAKTWTWNRKPFDILKDTEGLLDALKSERGSFSTKPIGKQAVKEQKDIVKNKEIMDVIKEAMRGPNKKGGGMIVNKEERLSDYLSDLPAPTEWNPLGRKWEF